ncbi:MAG: ComEC/Rec2 family competence protein [Bacteroides sp.]|nr:ComEC/Rec2 family competence protein [Bacteroides sp.]
MLPVIPLLPFTIVFIIGIWMEGCGVSVWIPLIFTLIGVLLSYSRRPYAALMFCGLMTGFTLGRVNTPPPLPAACIGQPCHYAGTAVEVKSYEPTQVLIVKVDSCGRAGCEPFMVKLTIPSSIPEVAERDRIEFVAALTEMSVTTDLPDETDYDALLRRMGVSGSGMVQPDSIRVSGLSPGVFNSIRRFRSAVTLAIVDLPLSSGLREFLNAVLTGDRDMLTADTRELFSVTGLSHVLALSGLHVGIIAWFVSILLLPLYLTGMRKIRWFIVVMVLWLFAVMTGLSPSVVRSVVMSTVFFISFSMQRVRSPFNSLCVAALFILILWPYALYTVGFQLSFLAVASIMLFADRFNPFSRRMAVLHAIASYPAVTLAAVLGTAVVSAYYFNIFPLLFLPVNFIGALLLPVIVAGGLLLLLLDGFGLPYGFLAEALDFVFNLLHSSALRIGKIPWGVINDVYIPGVSVWMWLPTLVLFVIWLYKKRNVYIVATLLCVVFSISTTLLLWQPKDGTDIFIPRMHDHTSLMVRTGNQLRVFTTAPPRIHEEIKEDYSHRYRRYMLSRGVDSISFHAVSRLSPEIITVGDKKFLLLHDGNALPAVDGRIDYAVICGGFRGRISSLTECVDTDSILLSADLNVRLHDRYLSELSEAGVAVRSLRHSPLRIGTGSVK